MDARYDVLTWDSAASQYSEQEGMRNPCLNVTLAGLRRALRELRDDFGYQCDRVRDKRGNHHSDTAVLVERVDDPVVDAW